MESLSTLEVNQVQSCPVGVRLIPAEADFVYVMRRDSDYVAAQFAERMGAEEALADIAEAYDRAVVELAAQLLIAFGVEHEHPAVDLLDAREVHERRLELIASLGPATVVSMDPLMELGALPLAFSRCYLPGGTIFVEMIPRPGYPRLEEQVAAIAAAAAGGPIVVVEDDFFTGDTLSTMLGTHLGDLFQSVVGVVAGTKVGLREPAFPVLPAVRYRCKDGRDPLEKLDLGDPRDYVIGASGLVCRLPSGQLGRLPYVLPFVSPEARASIPEAAEAEFSAAALGLSRKFYEELETVFDRAVTLDLADPAFATACIELLGVRPTMPLTELLDVVADHDAIVS